MTVFYAAANAEETAAVTASPTPTAEPTGIAPVSEEGKANMEAPDIQIGAPNENLDPGSLVWCFWSSAGAKLKALPPVLVLCPALPTK